MLMLDIVSKPKVLLMGLSTVLVCVGSQAQETDIALDNHSFEDTTITIPQSGDPNFGDPFATIVNTVPGWIETGPTYSRLGRTGQNDTGRFLNVDTLFPTSPTTAVNVPKLDESVDGDHIGFFVINPEVNGQDPLLPLNIASISQETAAVFETQTNYHFTMSIGSGQVFVASEDSTMVLSIGYFDQAVPDPEDDTFDAVGSFVPLSRLTITQPQMDLTNFLLQDFTVDLFAGDVTVDALGENVAVMVSQELGAGNTYNIDNARLTSTVPEPTSLALLGMSGLLILRRRR